MDALDHKIETSKKIIAKLDELDQEMENVMNILKKIEAAKQRCHQSGGLDQPAMIESGGKPPARRASRNSRIVFRSRL